MLYSGTDPTPEPRLSATEHDAFVARPLAGELAGTPPGPALVGRPLDVVRVTARGTIRVGQLSLELEGLAFSRDAGLWLHLRGSDGQEPLVQAFALEALG